MRTLTRTLRAQPSRDGDGVKIQRIAGTAMHELLDPFLMIDEIYTDNAADYIGGFPEHPHRGFETITYMKTGHMLHRDHMGNQGMIGAGDVQWMTAGAGVLHSEMPKQESGLLHGFQIWLNLPAAEKMKPAAYREIHNAQIPTLPLTKGGQLNAIAGTVSVDGQEITGPMPALSTQPVLLDVQLSAGENTALTFNPQYPAWVYVYDGELNELPLRHLGIFSAGEHLTLQAGTQGARLLVLSGSPLSEPIAQYGPFVMNHMEEVDQALRDFQNPDYINTLKAAARGE